MSGDPESIALGPMVVDGQIQTDDYEVVWRGLPIGRILKQPLARHWWWGCNVYGQQPTLGDRGAAIDFKDAQVRFKLAWTKIRPTLTDQNIAAAVRHAEELAQQRQIRDDGAPEAPLQVLDNLRAAPRQRVLKSGIIEFNGGAIDCVVRNISEPERHSTSRVRWASPRNLTYCCPAPAHTNVAAWCGAARGELASLSNDTCVPELRVGGIAGTLRESYQPKGLVEA